MTTQERMIKSARARKRRKEKKEIIAGIQKRYFRDMKKLRENTKKIMR